MLHGHPFLHALPHRHPPGTGPSAASPPRGGRSGPVRAQGEHGDRIVRGVPPGEDPSAEPGIAAATDKARPSQGLHVPLRPLPAAQGQGPADGLAFLQRGPVHVGMGMLPLLVGKPGEIHGPVIGIEVEQHAAGPQHPQPLRIGRLGIRQRPGQVAGQHAVEGGLPEVQLRGAHTAPVHRAACLIGQGGGQGEHPLARIDAVTSQPACASRMAKIPRPCPDPVCAGGTIFPARQPGQDLRPPQGRLVTVQFLAADLPEGAGTPGPVTPDAPVEPGPGRHSAPGAPAVCSIMCSFAVPRGDRLSRSWNPPLFPRHDHAVLPASWRDAAGHLPPVPRRQSEVSPCRPTRRMRYAGEPCVLSPVPRGIVPSASSAPSPSSRLPSQAERKGTTVSSIRRKRGLRALPSRDTGRCSAQRP